MEATKFRSLVRKLHDLTIGHSDEEFERLLEEVRRIRKEVWNRGMGILALLRDRIREEPEEFQAEITGIIRGVLGKMDIPLFIGEEPDPESQPTDLEPEADLDLEALLQESEDKSSSSKPNNP